HRETETDDRDDHERKRLHHAHDHRVLEAVDDLKRDVATCRDEHADDREAQPDHAELRELTRPGEALEGRVPLRRLHEDEHKDGEDRDRADHDLYRGEDGNQAPEGALSPLTWL